MNTEKDQNEHSNKLGEIFSEKTRLKHFSVKKLFGLFDHEIPMFLDDRVTLIYSPNGYGKTVILKLISAFFSGTFSFFATVEFSEIQLHLENGAIIKIIQGMAQSELFPNVRGSGRFYIISATANGERFDFNPYERGPGTLNVSPTMIDRYLPLVRRSGAHEWTDNQTGEVLTLQETVERYWQQLPPQIKRQPKLPTWLQTLRSSVACQLIETQRLLIFEKEHSYSSGTTKVVVSKNASDLSKEIGLEFGRSARAAQTLDSSFPNRLLSKIRSDQAPPPETALREVLSELEKKRERLSQVGLFNPNVHTNLITQSNLNENERRILSEYLADATKKLDEYNVILSKLEAFKRIINEHFQFKSIEITQEAGFKLKDVRGYPLPAESLSSGEQHELVLTYNLLFRTSPGTLILIDEPEISLHVAWQRQFIDDLKDIIKLTRIDALIATHSPQLIGANLDLTVQLQAPNDVTTA